MDYVIKLLVAGFILVLPLGNVLTSCIHKRVVYSPIFFKFWRIFVNQPIHVWVCGCGEVDEKGDQVKAERNRLCLLTL